MAKITYEAPPFSVPKEELLDAAKRFLLDSELSKDTIVLDNIYSPEFGSSDLLFADKGRLTLTALRLDDKNRWEKFIISSISYYVWLKESITVSKAFLNVKSQLDMYLVSYDFPRVACYFMESLSPKLSIFLIKYQTLQIEDLKEPVIHFQHMAPRNIEGDEPLRNGWQAGTAISTGKKETFPRPKVSTRELNEFNWLKERYLT